MNQFDPYLVFDGTCTEAMGFYEKALGGKIEAMLTGAQSPMAGKMPGMDDRVIHARLKVDGQVLMACDSPTGEKYEGMKGFWVSLIYPTNDKARQAFDALAEGGKTIMPMQKTLWSEAYGMVTDRFGTPWMVQGVMIPF
jgi:PhnB protein